MNPWPRHILRLNGRESASPNGQSALLGAPSLCSQPPGSCRSMALWHNPRPGAVECRTEGPAAHTTDNHLCTQHWRVTVIVVIFFF